MEERRKAARFKTKRLIAYLPDREGCLYAEGIDLSRGGLRCAAAKSVAPQTNVFLMIRVPASEGSERLVRCEGYVAHARLEGGSCVFGIRIDEIYEDDRPYFEAYLSSLEAGPPAGAPEPASS